MAGGKSHRSKEREVSLSTKPCKNLVYYGYMNKQDRTKLTKSYTQYRKIKAGKIGLLQFLRNFMPEIIFRTSKLEGESVTRRMITSLFK